MRFLERSGGCTPEHEQIPLAYVHQEGNVAPGLLFLPGYLSDMQSSKSAAVAKWAEEHGHPCTRFDYRGHGCSGGRLEEGILGQWIEDALTVLDLVTCGPQILIGSSMGGWIMIHLALLRPRRVVGMLGIAAAPDFTEDLIAPTLTPGDWQQLERSGSLVIPNEEQGCLVTAEFIREARQHLVMREGLAIDIPVRLLHGMADRDVPWATSQRLAERISGTNVQLTLIKDGQHRLSRQSDLMILERELGELVSLAAS